MAHFLARDRGAGLEIVSKHPSLEASELAAERLVYSEGHSVHILRWVDTWVMCPPIPEVPAADRV